VLATVLVLTAPPGGAIGKLKSAISSAIGISNQPTLSPVDSTATASSPRRPSNSQPFAEDQSPNATDSAGVGGFDILKIFEKKTTR
jgi:hypothetical protein